MTCALNKLDQNLQTLKHFSKQILSEIWAKVSLSLAVDAVDNLLKLFDGSIKIIE